ncbi:cation transporter [Indioceanicola profundi]|uniref:cation transporter n=1 Tax=Indioceanicola profundi TaxID=2220096 RepID=UPI001CEC791C|nr:cation transporter [Indioceanicola profundi]
MADALHNFSDAASLGVGLFARRISRRHSDERRTFGYAQAEVIEALVNLTTLIIVSFYLIAKAVGRVFCKHEPGRWNIVIDAGSALAIDIATALLTLSKGNMNNGHLHP